MAKSANTLDEATLKATASRILADCRTRLLQTNPFIGTIAMNMNIKPVRDQRVPTACTDGTNVFFDIEFLSKLSDAERLFVLAHEFWHNVMMHFARGENRMPKLFNIATDLEVNQILVQEGLTMPKDALTPQKLHLPVGLQAEDYYDLLLKNNNGSSNGNGGKGNGNDTGEQEAGSSYSKQERDSMQKTKMGTHLQGEVDDEKTAGQKSKDKYGELGNDADFNPGKTNDERELNEKKEKIREMIVAAAQQIERQRGDLPGYAKALVDKLLQPKVPWKELLAANVTSTMANRISWNTPNRRFAYSGTYLPAHSGEMLRLAIGVDTSGSTMGFLKEFLSEMVGIAKSFDAYEIHLIQCDTEVKNVETYSNEDNPFPDDANFEFQGFGGTTLMPIFNYVKENELDVDEILVFTDGECEPMTVDKAPEQPVCWVLPENCHDNALKFGEIIKMSKDNA